MTPARPSLAASAWRAVRLLFRTRPGASTAYVLISLGGAGLPAVQTLLLAALFTGGGALVTGSGTLAGLALAAFAYAAARLAEGAFSMVRNLAVESLQHSLITGLHGQVFAKAARLMLETFDDPGLYDQMARARAAIDSGRFLNQIRRAAACVESALTALGLAGAVAHFSPWLLVSLALAALPAALLRWRRGREFYLQAFFHSPRRRVLDYYAGVLRGRAEAKELRVFGIQAYFIDRWRSLRDELRRERWLFEKRSLKRELFLNIATTEVFAYVLALGAAVNAVRAGALDLGAFAATITALRSFQDYLRWSLIEFAEAADGLQYVADLFAYIDHPAEEPPPGRGRPFPRPLRQGIRYEDVHFTYPGADRPALSGITFDLRPGERLAVVGVNGAGKSTLVKLLLGWYRPTRGRITVDGTPQAEIDPESWRAAVSAVLQEYVRYQYLARENIGFGDLRSLADDARIATAVSRGGAGSVVAALPAGLATRLGKEFAGSTDLSGGEWQRLASARGFMREREVLVLDEPTASLDPLREADVFAHFAAMAAGRTVVLVSHRLASCRIADRILVLDGGRIVEAGTHDQLLASNGLYAGMYRKQAEWYR